MGFLFVFVFVFYRNNLLFTESKVLYSGTYILLAFVHNALDTTERLRDHTHLHPAILAPEDIMC